MNSLRIVRVIVGLAGIVGLVVRAPAQSVGAAPPIAVDPWAETEAAAEEAPMMLPSPGATRLTDATTPLAGRSSNFAAGAGAERLVVRGIAAAPLPEAPTSVTHLLDGIPLEAGAFTPEIPHLDLADVIVARGPQSSRHGAAALGGAVALRSNPPDLYHIGGRLVTTWSHIAQGDDNRGAHLVANAPLLVGRLGVRVVAYGDERGGFIDNRATGANDHNTQRTHGGRASIHWRASPTTHVRFAALYHQFAAVGTDQHEPGFDPALVGTPPLHEREIFNAIDGRTTDRTALAHLTLDTNLAWHRLTSFTTYTRRDRFETGDDLAAAEFGATFADTRAWETWTQDLQLASPDASLRWMAGVGFSRRQTRPGHVVQYFGPPDEDDDEPPTPTAAYAAQTELEQLAAYGELDYHFATRWTIAAGARYLHVTTRSDTHVLAGPDAGARYGPVGEIATPHVGHVQLTHRLARTTTAYALVQSGFRPGGFNRGDDREGYRADRVVNHELGASTALFDDALRVHAAAFVMHWRDPQLAWRESVANADRARITGAELSLVVTPFSGLALRFDATALDAELHADWTIDGDLVARAGAALPGVPRFTATLGADYRWMLSHDWQAFVGGAAAFVGEAPAALSSDSAAREPIGDYALLDARLGVVVGTCEISLFVTNATDVAAARFTDLALPRAERVFTTRPRTIGAQLAWGF